MEEGAAVQFPRLFFSGDLEEGAILCPILIFFSGDSEEDAAVKSRIFFQSVWKRALLLDLEFLFFSRALLSDPIISFLQIRKRVLLSNLKILFSDDTKEGIAV